jgi:hypothetical protein
LKSTIRFLVVVLTSLAFNDVGFAQVKSGSPVTRGAPIMDKHMEMKSEQTQATVLTGKVTSVDAQVGTLTLKVKDREINLTTDSKSTKAALEKLKAGDTVKVFEKGGKVIAASPVKPETKTKTTK